MLKTKRQPAIVLNSDSPAKREKKEPGVDSDSESEADLLERLFGKPEAEVKDEKPGNELIDLESDTEETTSGSLPVAVKKPECVWEDEADNSSAQIIARKKFSELSGGWINIKQIRNEETFGDLKIFKKDKKVLPEKEIDLEEVGSIGIRGAGPVTGFQFHPQAPVGMVTQADILTMFQIDGQENPKLQSIRLDKFHIKCAKIISKTEILCTSDMSWFYSYNLESGEIRRFPFLRGVKMNKLFGFYSSYDNKFLAFPDNAGKINIASASSKEVIDILQSGTNSSLDCCFSRDGLKLWSLSETGEVMCFDLRQMKAINSFSDMPGATSLGINGSETIFSVGSTSGLINLFNAECQVEEECVPFKTIKNLRAPVTLQKFNQNGELALFSSDLVAGQCKLYHTASESVIRNFPGSRKIDAIKFADFSPGSGFMGIGNKNVKLFKLNHYARY